MSLQFCKLPILTDLFNIVKPETKKQGINYFTHDNGGRPFKVSIFGNIIKVYKIITNGKSHGYYDEPCLVFAASKIFIGKSLKNKITMTSGSHGSFYDGNTLLFKIGFPQDLKYIYIGDHIFKFKALSKIETYFSPVDNSDVPYPYAVDKNGRYYLIGEEVILHKFVPSSYMFNPYHYYDDNRDLVKKFHFYGYDCVKSYDGIADVFSSPLEDFRLSLSYCPKEEDFGYDWTRDGGEIWYKKIDEDMCLMDKDEYLKIMDHFEKYKGFSKLNKIILEESVW